MPGSRAQLSITAFGMATPLAPTALDSCAAARAGISRFAELSIIDLTDDEALGHEPLTGCQAAYIGSGFTGRAKVLLLGRLALEDLHSRRKLTREEMSRTGFIINLSDRLYEDATFIADDEDARLPSEVWATECRDIIPAMLAGSCLESSPAYQSVYFGGHAGFVEALSEADSLVSHGTLDRCLIGGVESCIEPRLLRSAALKQVLKTDANPVGFMAGEAAAFVLVEKTSALDAPMLCGYSSVKSVPTRFSNEPPDGKALAQAIADTLRASGVSSRISSLVVVGDLNGDEYRARDWGSALSRLRARSYVDEVDLHLPAIAFGDCGAATEAINVCFGIVAQQRGWVPPGLMLQWTASDRGARSAIGFAAIPA